MRISQKSLEKLVPQRIRSRREELGLQAFVVAKTAGISGSYLSLIEKGVKVPSEEIAVRLARALKDDPEIYRAWVHVARHPDLLENAWRLARLSPYSNDPELRQRLKSGKSIELDDEKLGLEEIPPALSSASLEPASLRRRRMARWLESRRDVAATSELIATSVERLRDRTASPEPSATVDVPLLADGVDPERAADVVEILHLDRKLVPPDAEGLFAYRPALATVERVQGLVRPQDVVVLADPKGAVDRGGIYAVRHKGRIVLSRIAVHDNVLLLLPWGDAGEPLSVEVGDEQALRERLAGVVVATVRAWQPGSRSMSSSEAVRPLPRGRSVRLEDDFLVRDCEWREDYGWRPVQRPEDMDYLDAHPGTRIRFRLIRDGRVRYRLEMDPDEWRGALGDYYEGPSWRRNGYIVAITRRREGAYTEEFQERWEPYVREADEG